VIGVDRSEALTEVALSELPLARFDGLLSPAGIERLRRAVATAGPLLEGRTVWNVNSTRRGGGVAELLESLLPYARGAGVDARWLVVHGDDRFFRLTKRLHNRLHGAVGDGGPLGREERDAYEAAVAPAARALADRVKPGDVVILHDPQTAALTRGLGSSDVKIVWRAHIGVDEPGDLVRSAWEFLRPFVQAADICVFSRPSYAWDVVPEAQRAFISPSIDPFAPKNEDLDADTVRSILIAAGLRRGNTTHLPAAFTRSDGTVGTVRSRVRTDGGRLPRAGDPLVLQVSRWDALKDPLGVIDAFVRHVAPYTTAHLLYAGPEVAAVSDDPEGAQVLDGVRAHRRALPAEVRPRVHLAMLPLADPEENAAIVNALQRSATVVVQKSLAEGFGLTVAEAMWKGRPVVASAIGGIQDQI
jgi:trehalose synthase